MMINNLIVSKDVPPTSFNLVANQMPEVTALLLVKQPNLQGILQPYPLYDELVRRVESRTEKSIDIKRVCTSINNIAHTLPPEEASSHYMEIGALILHHELLSNNGVLLSLVPFDGKVMVGGKGVLHYITNLPPNLQQIIAQYVENPDVS